MIFDNQAAIRSAFRSWYIHINLHDVTDDEKDQDMRRAWEAAVTWVRFHMAQSKPQKPQRPEPRYVSEDEL